MFGSLYINNIIPRVCNDAHPHNNLKPTQMVKGKRKPKETEHVTIRKNDEFRRNNLLTNAAKGVGKASEKDGNVILRCGTESYGYVIYTILNAKLADYGIHESTKR